MPRRQTRSRSSRLIALISVLILLPIAACSPQPPDRPRDVTEKLGPAGPIPTGLDQFYLQSVHWTACGSFASSPRAKSAFSSPKFQCARVTVPMAYSNPQGDTITLGMLRHRASKPEQKIGSLLVNPGGPGASGMETAAGLSSVVDQSPLGERFDLVGFDPRGVGASQPQIRCLTGPERDTERATDSEADGSADGVAKQEAEAKDFAAKCVQRTERGAATLANLGTRDVAKDLDVLRAVLGDRKLSYLGYSYGTRIGYTYAEAFPENVRALVLDGALNPGQDETESLIAQGQGFGTAFTKFTDWCVAREDCALGRDAAGATAAFQALTRPLIDNPVDAGGGRKLGFGDATTAAVQALYSPQLWESLNTGLAGLKLGQGAILMQLADQYNDRSSDGSYTNTQDAFTAIRCVDDPPLTDKTKLAEAMKRYDQAAPFLDDGRPDGVALDTCAFWPVPNTSQPHEPKVSNLAPTLVISTTEDPATPYQAGVNLAKALNGRLLTFEGTQHTVFLQGNACVDQAGTAYLLEGKLPAEGIRCTS